MREMAKESSEARARSKAARLNIYLDGLHKELESRGLSFCRYADDGVIFVKSERSGQRILTGLTDWIAKHLKLRVKTQTKVKQVALGMENFWVSESTTMVK